MQQHIRTEIMIYSSGAICLRCSQPKVDKHSVRLTARVMKQLQSLKTCDDVRTAHLAYLHRALSDLIYLLLIDQKHIMA